MKNYDIIIIGFGKAGKTLAVKAANLGKKVAVIEKSAQMYGGTCINVGCIPTKKLVNLSKEAKYVNNNVAGEYFTLSVEKKDKLISALRAKNFAMLDSSENIDVINGTAKFVDKNSVEVAAADGSKSVFTAPTIVINTGSVNEKPSFEVSSNLAYDSTGILNLKTLPKRLAVVGGGYIGLEFASMFAEFGSKVTIVARSGVLKNEDEDVKESVKTLLQTQGIEILEGCEVKNLKDGTLNFTQNGETKSLDADAFLLATGRVAATAELNLSADCVVVGIVAVLRAAKNHQLLFEAFSELNLPNTALVVVGDGPQEENLKKIKTPSIYMLGSRTDVSEFLGSFDVFVLPSKMEALGTALLEAQSCGVPCIGSDAGGIGEAISSGETGLLFKNGDKESLKAALKTLIEDAALRAKFSANAREFIVRNFSIETMVAQTEAMYEAL